MQSKNITTSYRQELKGRIVKTAATLFYRHGIKSVTMDDIASALSISKRTLYEIYDNKEDVLFEVMLEHDREIRQRMERFDNPDSNVMDIIIEFYRMQLEELSVINPLFFEDSRKYPKILQHIHATHDKRKQQSVDFFERGVREGYFREDVNFDIIQKVAHEAPQFVMNSGMYRDYSLKEISYNLLMLFMRGVSTAKGIQVLDKFLDKQR